MKRTLAVCVAIAIMAMSSFAVFADEAPANEIKSTGDVILFIDPPGNG